jgi:hypothetical protein
MDRHVYKQELGFQISKLELPLIVVDKTFDSPYRDPTLYVSSTHESNISVVVDSKSKLFESWSFRFTAYHLLQNAIDASIRVINLPPDADRITVTCLKTTQGGIISINGQMACEFMAYIHQKPLMKSSDYSIYDVFFAVYNRGCAMPPESFQIASSKGDFPQTNGFSRGDYICGGDRMGLKDTISILMNSDVLSAEDNSYLPPDKRKTESELASHRLKTPAMTDFTVFTCSHRGLRRVPDSPDFQPKLFFRTIVIAPPTTGSTYPLSVVDSETIEYASFPNMAMVDLMNSHRNAESPADCQSGTLVVIEKKKFKALKPAQTLVDHILHGFQEHIVCRDSSQFITSTVFCGEEEDSRRLQHSVSVARSDLHADPGSFVVYVFPGFRHIVVPSHTPFAIRMSVVVSCKADLKTSGQLAELNLESKLLVGRILHQAMKEEFDTLLKGDLRSADVLPVTSDPVSRLLRSFETLLCVDSEDRKCPIIFEVLQCLCHDLTGSASNTHQLTPITASLIAFASLVSSEQCADTVTALLAKIFRDFSPVSSSQDFAVLSELSRLISSSAVVSSSSQSLTKWPLLVPAVMSVLFPALVMSTEWPAARRAYLIRECERTNNREKFVHAWKLMGEPICSVFAELTAKTTNDTLVLQVFILDDVEQVFLFDSPEGYIFLSDKQYLIFHESSPLLVESRDENILAIVASVNFEYQKQRVCDAIQAKKAAIALEAELYSNKLTTKLVSFTATKKKKVAFERPEKRARTEDSAVDGIGSIPSSRDAIRVESLKVIEELQIIKSRIMHVLSAVERE